MKPINLLLILPILAALTGCGEDVKVSPNQVNIALTETPKQLVIYPDDRPSIPDGKPVFAQNCASCHGATGLGGTASVKFDQTWALATKPVDIYQMVAFGGGKSNHPAFNGKLTPRELWNVSLYAKSLGQPPLNDTEIATIDAVFGSNCAVCHGTKGDGDGPLARNLEPMPANFQRFNRFFNRTDDVLFDHIANGIRWEGMPNFLGKQDKAKNVKFDEPYIRKLVQYVHKFHVTNAAVLTANAVKPAGGGGAATTELGTQQDTGAPPPQGAAGTTTSTTTTTTTGSAAPNDNAGNKNSTGASNADGAKSADKTKSTDSAGSAGH